MKRIVCFSALCLLSSAMLMRAQDTTTPLPSSPANSGNTAAAIASRQEAEENYNTLKGHVDDLIQGQADLDKRIQSLEKDIADLRMQMSKPTANNYASQESLKALADAVQEIDKKREADKELILKELEKLGKLVAGAPPMSHESFHDSTSSIRRNSSEESSAPVSHGDQPGFYYVIKSGDTLSLIAQAYREQGIKVTTHQIAEANPNVNPAKLLVGTKIFIPAPKGSVLKNKD